MRIYTESGSVYEIDSEAQRWERLEGTSPALRTRDGFYRKLIFRGVGYPMVITGEPLTPGTDERRIITSPVVDYE
jgi:hypothetical protein